MSIRTKLTIDEIKEIFRDVMEEFRGTLIEELKQNLQESAKELKSNDPLVRTDEVCQRWDEAELRLAK